ncbi:MAG: CRISPR-associated endonuclease Cas3'' [Gammaproteobacteria bacterium]|nr:CRISPR-associated endonuclease Cas3'' [Gammaproteobacteria bacterium]
MGKIAAQFIAHRRKNGEEQLLVKHLAEVGEIAAQLASKIGVSDVGTLVGLLHDMGKFSADFQSYIGSATGKIKFGEENYVDFDGLKGKIDHSSAGAQWAWKACQKWGPQGQLIGQILALCIASHHSGLIDCLKPEGENSFSVRMGKPDDKTHKNESLNSAPEEYVKKLEALLNKELIQNVFGRLKTVSQAPNKSIRSFNIGFFTRLLFSCLIDADRMNSADFECPENKQHRSNQSVEWAIAIKRLEHAISELDGDKPIDELRRQISNTCRDRAQDAQGIYTLTVPTGGGKTYASLRSPCVRLVVASNFHIEVERNEKKLHKII